MSTPYPSFPEISRRPALKDKDITIDPTLRDSMENGMETTRAKFRRQRRQWTVAIEYLTADDVATLRGFVVNTAVYGANIFRFPDNRDPRNPQSYAVRFSQLPKFDDAGWVGEEFRKNCSFELREV